jgi:tetratricopeptide (TPR) repeat protein
MFQEAADLLENLLRCDTIPLFRDLRFAFRYYLFSLQLLFLLLSFTFTPPPPFLSLCPSSLFYLLGVQYTTSLILFREDDRFVEIWYLAGLSYHKVGELDTAQQCLKRAEEMLRRSREELGGEEGGSAEEPSTH